MSDQDAYAQLQTTDEAEELALDAETPPDDGETAPEPEHEQDWRDVVRERANEPRDLNSEPPPVIEDVPAEVPSEPNSHRSEHSVDDAARDFDSEGDEPIVPFGLATSADKAFAAQHGLSAVELHAEQVAKEIADLRDLRDDINFRIKHLVVYASAFESMQRIATKARSQIAALEADETETEPAVDE